MSEKLEGDKKADSAPYPYFALAGCMRIAESVKELGGGRAEVHKHLLASHLKESEKSASFGQRIASAKCFGLIEGRQSFILTERSKRYFFPTSDADKSIAMLEFLSCPSAFAEIIKRFDGSKLPPTQMLGNILHRELRVPESWKDRAAAYFIRSAQFVGAIDEQGCLRFKASQYKVTSRHQDALETLPGAIKVPLEGGTFGMPTPISSLATDPGVDVITLNANGQKLRLELPSELSHELWTKLNNYIEAINPRGPVTRIK